MSIKLENILSSEQLKKLSQSDVNIINEAIVKRYDEALSAKQAELEEDTSHKFDKLVEGLSKKFDEQVTNTIIESAKSDTNDLINRKLYNIVKGVVNLLENSGITTTEKTKELQEKLNSANKNLETAWHEREIVKSQLTDAEKENFILMQLKGMNPEIVTSALDFFKDKDILDVQDGIKAFLDGDFSNLDLDKQDQLSGDLDLEQVERACEDIDTNASDRARDSEKLLSRSKEKVFEGLGRGIKQRKSIISNGPDISLKALEESANTSEETGPDEEDTITAMEQIDNFANLGMNFGGGDNDI